MKNKIPEIDKELAKSLNHFPVVGIGASAGGLDAFKKLLKAIPEESGMAYVLVQHLDPNHESMLVELLQKVTTIPVLEISDDIKVQPNHIYILPSNKMMIANDGVLELSPRPAKSKNERNLPIDLFFTSLAEVHQSHAIGVVLSGTASDGTMGLKAIKNHGGITFAQDEESAAYEGMPHSAAEAGVVDFILSPDKIPQKLLEVINIIKGKDVEDIPQQDEDVFKQILSLLRIRKGTDFTYYKQSTIRRRILRRMAINKTEELTLYLKYLREKKTEQDLLYQDLLIPVTDFFRDPKIFDSICKSVFPLIVKNKKEGEPIRIWVAGCSTGEEVYSIAICFRELIGDRFSADGHQRIQIFATDISEPAITKARNGIYSKSDVVGLTEAHLNEYFTKNNGDYQVKKSIRDLCVFAQHNFLKDPAFSKMDFISCRNVLIYMEPYLQKKALITFHYALNPKGYLLLGKSETTSGVPEHFAVCQLKGTAKTDKIFTRKDIQSRFVPTASPRTEKNFDINIDTKSEAIRTNFQKTADDIILSKYTPAGVVVNEVMDIVHFRGRTGLFLEPSPGKASLNLLKMAKDGLAFELRNILHKAKKENTTVLKENIPIQVNGEQHNISIEAMPLPDIVDPHYLILFHDQLLNTNSQIATSTKKTSVAAKSTSAAKDLRIQQLEKELAQSREDMRSITEDQEAANEELQSANEELLSGSEELQSLNEEMETSKEELQSTNEELTVVNQEIIGLNEQVTEARDYAEAIISNLHEPLLVLDKHLRVKSANYAFYKNFQVNEKDTEGTIIFDLGNKQWNIPELRELLQNILDHKVKFENFEVAHNFPNIGERIVVLNARELVNESSSEKLILLAIADITEQKIARKKIEESEHRYQSMVYNSPSMIAILKGEDMIIEIANDAMIETWGKGKDIIGKSVFEVMPETVEQGFDKMLQQVYETGEPLLVYEMPVTIIRNGEQELMHYTFIYQAQRNVQGKVEGVAILANEVTLQVEAKIKIKESEERFRTLADNVPMNVFIIEPTAEANISYWNKHWLDYTGQTEEEAVANAWNGFVHPDDLQPIMDVFVPAFEARQPYFLPCIRIKRYDGAYRWFAVQSNPRYLPNGEFMGYIGVGFDIHEKKLAEDALKESETFNRTVLESSPDCVKIIDTAGRIQYMNTNGMCIMEVDDFGTIKNKPWSELWGEDNKQTILDAVGKAIGGEAAQFQAMCATDKGTIKWWDVIVSPVHEAGSNTVTNIISVSRDITELKASQSLLNFRKALLEANNEASIDGILLVDAKGKILSFNKKFIEIWNMPQHIVDADDDDAALAFAMTQLINPEQFIEKVNYLYKNPTETTMDILEFKNGKMVERYGYPVIAEDGNQFVWSWSFRDITEQKRIERELIEAKEFAENAVKSKQQFLSNMSHEIRTPLNSIIGFTNVLLKTVLDEKQKDFVKAVKTSSNSLNLLINDILDLAKVDAGKMTFAKQPFEIKKSINSILHSFDLKIKEKNLQIVSEYDSKIPAMVVGDSMRLNQIIVNLISNAIKFTHQGKIVLNVKVQSEEGENICIEFAIKDTGIGIAKNKIESIFNLFEQAEITTSNSYGGTGLGLAIVKQLVELQGGSIGVISQIDKGSTFRFIMPFGKTNLKKEQEIELLEIHSKMKKMRVLVAEDVALNQLLIKMILSDFGFEHDVVNNGKLAVEKLQTNTYDVVLMDLQMPEMNGFEATEYIRKTMKSTIPIIALTADVMSVDVVKCKEFGMDDYISKPIDEKLLYTKIVTLVEGNKTD